MILLTVPHAVCIPVIEERHCDRMALNAAITLDSILGNSEVVIGNELRSNVDLNRDIALNRRFRRDIKDLLDELDVSIILDIHSFPKLPHIFDNSDLTILDEVPGTDYSTSLYQDLNKNLSHKYKVRYYHGKNNSIMAEMRQLGYPSILIEFSEALTNKELLEICRSIKEWLDVNGYL